MLGQFVITGAIDEDITFSKAQVAFKFVGAFNPENLINVSLTINDGNKEKAKSVNFNPKSLINGVLNNTVGLALTVPKNAHWIAEVYGYLRNGTMQTGIGTDSAQTFLSLGGNMETTILAEGQKLIVVDSAGKLTALLSASAPGAQVVAGDSTVATVAYKISASKETFKISKMEFTLPSESASGIVDVAILSVDGQEIARKTIAGFASGGRMTFYNVNLAVPPTSAVTLSVSYKLKAVSSAELSGKNIRTILTNMWSTDSKQVAYHSKTQVAGNSIYVYKSFPVISVSALSGANLIKGLNIFNKFSVTANGGQRLAWRRMSFVFKCKFDIFSCGLNYGSPVAKEDGIYSLEVVGPGVAVGEQQEIRLIKDLVLYRTDTIGGIVNQLPIGGSWHFVHNTNGTVEAVFIAGADQEVSGSRSYTLKGIATSAVIAGDFVSSQILQSSVAIVTGQNPMNANASFVWTDYSAPVHNMESGDWHNDYLIKNLPTALQTVRK
ncbi:MAG TPA: hypothetical protein VJB62_04415 [Patescibacteria group bacterium]|nr:hypothetical protein [Patescibacteria group bacterium]